MSETEPVWCCEACGLPIATPRHGGWFVTLDNTQGGFVLRGGEITVKCKCGKVNVWRCA